jgi:hypothetical protein
MLIEAYVAQKCSSVADHSHVGIHKIFFIYIIQYQPQFVKCVIIRALRIGLFVFFKCWQIGIFSNIFFRQFPSPDICPTHHSKHGERSERTDNKNPRKL